MYRFCLLSGLLSGLLSAGATEVYPKADWQPRPSPFASADAYPGGEFKFWSGPFPKSFNYYLDTTVTSSRVFNLLFETLLSNNGLTLEFEPGLAASWSVSADRMNFEFRLDERARWSDGVPVSAHDVAWTYAAVMNPKNLTGPHKISFERFHAPEVIDDRTIRFTAREVHWKNLLALGSFHVLPAHVFKDQDFNKINFEFPVVAGPYTVETMREGRALTLKRREGWWQRQLPGAAGIANFERLKFRFFCRAGKRVRRVQDRQPGLLPGLYGVALGCGNPRRGLRQQLDHQAGGVQLQPHRFPGLCHEPAPRQVCRPTRAPGPGAPAEPGKNEPHADV